jgi:hypothetical protein
LGKVQLLGGAREIAVSGERQHMPNEAGIDIHARML